MSARSAGRMGNATGTDHAGGRGASKLTCWCARCRFSCIRCVPTLISLTGRLWRAVTTGAGGLMSSKAEAHHRVEALCRQALDRNDFACRSAGGRPLVGQYLRSVTERLNALLDRQRPPVAPNAVRQVLARIRSNIMNLIINSTGRKARRLSCCRTRLAPRAMWQPQMEA